MTIEFIHLFNSAGTATDDCQIGVFEHVTGNFHWPGEMTAIRPENVADYYALMNCIFSAEIGLVWFIPGIVDGWTAANLTSNRYSDLSVINM